MDDLQARYQGALLGLAIGDALGTPLEFKPRGSFTPVIDFVGGGPFNLAPGQWTDDTSMALCLATSLVERDDFDPRDQMDRYVAWWQRGDLSSTGTCFDIGRTVRGALERYLASGEPYSGSDDPRSAGNGSLMRLAPVVLFAFPDEDAAIRLAAASSRTTHAAPEAVECCQIMAAILCDCLRHAPAASLSQVLQGTLDRLAGRAWQPRISEVVAGSYRTKGVQAIRGSGYCVESLEAALWCCHHGRAFTDIVLAAVNLGDDADTTGAIAGQLAGAWFGASGIPARWRDRLHMAVAIENLATKLYERAR